MKFKTGRIKYLAGDVIGLSNKNGLAKNILIVPLASFLHKLDFLVTNL